MSDSTTAYLPQKHITGRDYDIDPDTGCWVWRKHRSANGYGMKSFANRNPVGAHRWYYEQEYGPVPEGLVLDHLCGNRACVNPQHLEAVPQRTNVMRGNGPTKHNALKTHCKHGHPFDEENTYWRPTGGRMCLACKRERNRGYMTNARRRAGVPVKGSRGPYKKRGVIPDDTPEHVLAHQPVLSVGSEEKTFVVIEWEG